MKIQVTVEAKPFQVPNYVVLEAKEAYSKTDGPPSIPLSEIPEDELHRMVDEWVSAVYKKAGKNQPPQAC